MGSVGRSVDDLQRSVWNAFSQLLGKLRRSEYVAITDQSERRSAYLRQTLQVCRDRCTLPLDGRM